MRDDTAEPITNVAENHSDVLQAASLFIRAKPDLPDHTLHGTGTEGGGPPAPAGRYLQVSQPALWYIWGHWHVDSEPDSRALSTPTTSPDGSILAITAQSPRALYLARGARQ